jgi:hypothetical protein
MVESDLERYSPKNRVYSGTATANPAEGLRS